MILSTPKKKKKKVVIKCRRHIKTLIIQQTQEIIRCSPFTICCFPWPILHLIVEVLGIRQAFLNSYLHINSKCLVYFQVQISNTPSFHNPPWLCINCSIKLQRELIQFSAFHHFHPLDVDYDNPHWYNMLGSLKTSNKSFVKILHNLNIYKFSPLIKKVNPSLSPQENLYQ